MQKTQGFGKFWCNLQQKSTEMAKNKGETIIFKEIKDETFKTLQNGYNFNFFEDFKHFCEHFPEAFGAQSLHTYLVPF